MGSTRPAGILVGYALYCLAVFTLSLFKFLSVIYLEEEA